MRAIERVQERGEAGAANAMVESKWSPWTHSAASLCRDHLLEEERRVREPFGVVELLVIFFGFRIAAVRLSEQCHGQQLLYTAKVGDINLILQMTRGLLAIYSGYYYQHSSGSLSPKRADIR